MHTLKSVWKKTIWTAIFCAFLALIVFMSQGMANNQPVIFAMFILAAIVGAIALVYSKHKEALVIALLAVTVDVFLEASYWSSTIEDIGAQIVREKAQQAARDIVIEKRKERYSNSEVGKAPAQIEAEIRAAQQNERWTSSKNCMAATATASRVFCEGYFKLQAELAAAKEASSLEETVWGRGTTIEVDMPRNLAKGAMWISDITGVSVQSATNFLVAALVLFTMAGLALPLRIGFMPEKPQETPTQAKPIEAPIVPEAKEPGQGGVSELPGQGGGMVENDDPDPDGGEEIVAEAAPEEEVFRDATKNPPHSATVLNHPMKDKHPTNASFRIEEKLSTGEVKHFLRDCMQVDKEALLALRSAIQMHEPFDDDAKAKLMPSDTLYTEYGDWCGANNLAKMPKKMFSMRINRALKIKGGKHAANRDADGLLFPLLRKAAIKEPIKVYA